MRKTGKSTNWKRRSKTFGHQLTKQYMITDVKYHFKNKQPGWGQTLYCNKPIPIGYREVKESGTLTRAET